MQAVTEFVEQRFYVLMREQGRFVGGRRREVAKQSDGRPLVFSIRHQFAADDVELCEVIEFSFAREHVEVKHAQRLATGGVGYQIKLEIIDPFVRRGDFFKWIDDLQLYLV